MKKLILFFLLYPVFLACSDNIEDKIKPTIYQISDSFIVSDTLKELMAHCSMFYFDEFEDNGTVYLAYYCDDTKTTENPVNTSTYLVLSKFNIENPAASIERKVVFRANETWGNFTQGNRAPYDPNLIILTNQVNYYFNAYINNKVTLACRIYNKENGNFGDILTCKLKYKKDSGEQTVTNFNTQGLYDCLVENEKIVDYPVDFMFSTRIILHTDGFYYAAVGSLGTFNGIILKSSDTYTWEVVTITPNNMLCMEPQLEIIDNLIYVVARTNSDGCKYSTYDMNTKNWSNVKHLSGSVYSKPAIIYNNDKLYMIYNYDYNITTEWGYIPRSCIKIVEVDKQNNSFKDIAVFQNETGIHYPCLNRYRNSLYLSFSEDRRKLDITQVRSNIAFARLDM